VVELLIAGRKKEEGKREKTPEIQGAGGARPRFQDKVRGLFSTARLARGGRGVVDGGGSNTVGNFAASVTRAFMETDAVTAQGLSTVEIEAVSDGRMRPRLWPICETG